MPIKKDAKLGFRVKKCVVICIFYYFFPFFKSLTSRLTPLTYLFIFHWECEIGHSSITGALCCHPWAWAAQPL